MLTLADLLNLIRLTELELDRLHKDVESNSESTRNNAGEIIVQIEKLSQKLKVIYETTRGDDSHYPSYDSYITLLEKTKQ